MSKSGDTTRVAVLPHCDFCMENGITRPATVDGKTKNRYWANMCETHFIVFGLGVGTGIGQRLILEPPVRPV